MAPVLIRPVFSRICSAWASVYKQTKENRSCSQYEMFTHILISPKKYQADIGINVEESHSESGVLVHV
jgi:hypothetical protein